MTIQEMPTTMDALDELTERDRITCLRPGILVSLKSSIKGNRTYTTDEIEAVHETEDGEERSRWETTRLVTLPEEYDAAVTARGKARTLITNICSKTEHGLLCPESREQELRDAIKQARAIVREFNKKSVLTDLKVNVVRGRVAQDDVEAVRAISGELQDLMKVMEDGIKACDVSAVRNAAYKMKSVGQMLNPEAREQVEDAIKTARVAATKIVKAGEQAAIEIDTAAIEKIATARMTFLDLDDALDNGAVLTPAVQAARAVDLDVEPLPEEVNDAV